MMDDDWRVTEGPAIGKEPVFEVSEVHVDLRFFVTGAMSRSIAARLTTAAPTVVQSTGRALRDMEGWLCIHDSQPEQSYPGLYADHFGSITLYQNRGALALPSPELFVVHLYLPPEQFAATMDALAPKSGRTVLEIEIDRTLHQALPEEEHHFWNDTISPVILFNAFGFVVSPAF